MLTSTGSKAAVACISTMQLVNNFNSTTSVIQVGSRIIWAFARDGGFVFPKHFAKVNKNLACPLLAVIMSWAIAAVVSVLYLASTTAFNALLSCLVMLAYFAYCIPIACLLLRGRQYDRPGTFKLGKYGWFINVAALFFMAFLAVFFCFPVYRPVTKDNMSKFYHHLICYSSSLTPHVQIMPAWSLSVFYLSPTDFGLRWERSPSGAPPWLEVGRRRLQSCVRNKNCRIGTERSRCSTETS